MKINFDKINRANTLFIFIAFLGIIAVVLGTLVVSAITSLQIREGNRGIKIEPVANEESEPAISKDIVAGGNFIAFAVESRKLANEKPGSMNSKLAKMFVNNSPDYKTINYIVYDLRSKERKNVFEKDCLIMFAQFGFSELTQGKVFTKNLYYAATEDSNSDGYLGYEDDKKLYYSDLNGDKLSLMGGSVEEFQIVGNDLVLFRESVGQTYKYYTFNLASSQRTEVLSSTDLKAPR